MLDLSAWLECWCGNLPFKDTTWFMQFHRSYPVHKADELQLIWKFQTKCHTKVNIELIWECLGVNAFIRPFILGLALTFKGVKVIVEHILANDYAVQNIPVKWQHGTRNSWAVIKYYRDVIYIKIVKLDIDICLNFFNFQKCQGYSPH